MCALCHLLTDTCKHTYIYLSLARPIDALAQYLTVLIIKTLISGWHLNWSGLARLPTIRFTWAIDRPTTLVWAFFPALLLQHHHWIRHVCILLHFNTWCGILVHTFTKCQQSLSKKKMDQKKGYGAVDESSLEQRFHKSTRSATFAVSHTPSASGPYCRPAGSQTKYW